MDIETLRELCLQQPAATEEIKWKTDLVFMVGKKMFCVADTEVPFNFSVKVPTDQFEAWCARPGIVPAPYFARAHWVQVRQVQALSFAEVQGLVAESYRLVAAKLSKKEKESLGLF